MKLIDWHDYQVKARSTAMYPDIGENFVLSGAGFGGRIGRSGGKD